MFVSDFGFFFFLSEFSIIEMELKDLQSDLEALRELYGFLQCGGDVASKSNIVVVSNSLGNQTPFIFLFHLN